MLTNAATAGEMDVCSNKDVIGPGVVVATVLEVDTVVVVLNIEGSGR